MADTEFSSLITRRLVLRRFREDDLPAFCRYRSDPEVARYQDWSDFSEEEGVRFLSEMAILHPDIDGTWFQFAIERAGTGTLIGDLGLRTAGPQAEFGFTLSRGHQGKGYATEAVTRLLDYVFTVLSKHRVTATVDARNARSIGLLERVGMRREGHFIQNVWFKGAWGDEYLYALLRDEWSRGRESAEDPPVLRRERPQDQGSMR